MALKEKYTLVGAGAVFLGVPAIVLLMFVVSLPFALFFAWVKSEIWNWFAIPYFHLPRIGTWLMFMISMFISCFATDTRGLKEEYYAQTIWTALWGRVTGYLLILLEAYCIHHWILKG